MSTEYKGSLGPKRRAELEEIASLIGIVNPTDFSKPNLIAEMRMIMEERQAELSVDPRFKRLYSKPGPGRPSNATRATESPNTYSPAAVASKYDKYERGMSSSLSPEEDFSHAASSSFVSGGIPKGRELPRSPIKQVTDHLPSLAVPGSVKKIAKSIFSAHPAEVLARPAEVVDEVVHHGEEVIQQQAARVSRKAHEVVHDVSHRAHEVVHDVQEFAHDAQEAVEQGMTVPIDQVEVITNKIRSTFDERIWKPSGRYLSTQSNQTLLLLTLESILLLSRTLLFRTLNVTFPPSHPALHPNSAQDTPIAGEYNIDHPNTPPPHVLRNQNSLHPWLALDVRVPDWQTSFRGWDATQRLYLPLFLWAAVTIALPAILSALIGSKGNAGGKTLVFHILRLGVWGALVCQSGAGGLVVEGLRATGLDGGLGVVSAGVGVLMGFARALGERE